MDVYRGADKVAELGSYDELRIGANKPAFIYEGNELVYPAPVRDGLVLWYDFSGRTNGDAERGVAEDLSGNGNHGTLQNFNYTAESGYDKNKLLFDGVDDYITSKNKISARSMEVTLKVSERTETYSTIMSTFNGDGNGGFIFYNYNPYIRIVTTDGQFTTTGLNVGDFVTLTIVFTEEECILYFDGELVESFPFVGYQPEQSNPNSGMQGIMVGRYYSRNIYMSKDEFYSVRAYEKALTPSEIAHNYAIEKERFGIE